MTRWYHMPCPKCGSKDNLSYKDGDEWGFCFGCSRNSPIDPSAKRTPKEDYDMHSLEEIGTYDERGFQERDIKKIVAKHYGVKVSYAEDGTISSHFYPYTKGNDIVAYKERKLPKTFSIHGDFKGVDLFGKNVCQGGKRIIITEGELDTLAVAQAQYDKYSRFYPVCGLPSASNTKMLIDSREWLRSFDEVVLMLDSDEPGQKATQEAAKIIGYDKVKIATLPEKDPCDVLIKHGSDVLMKCIFDARSASPAGVVKGQDVWEQYQRRKDVKSLKYPPCLDGLNEKLHGMRMGEITLFTSGTGSGKSTVIKEIVMQVLENTEDMVGMVSLEESIGDTAQKFIGMKLQKNLSMEDVSEKEQKEAFDAVFADERLILLDHQGSVSDDSLLDKIEHLALLGCKYIILDHITLAISEGINNKTGNEATDSFMSGLLKTVKKHDIWMGVVSHLRKGDKKVFEEGDLPTVDDIRGSGSIKQISFDIIAFARDMTAETVNIRNTIKLRVLKSRFTGLTGDAGLVSYIPETGRLQRKDIVDFD